MSTETSVLSVDGMTCGSCVAHVTRALRALSGVKAVEVQLGAGRVAVEHRALLDGGPTTAALVAALEDAGYPARI